MITKNEAKLMWEYYDKLIPKLMNAKLALLEGGVKSYTIDDRVITRFDIERLTGELDDAVKKRSYYENIMNGRSVRKAVAAVPRDF